MPCSKWAAGVSCRESTASAPARGRAVKTWRALSAGQRDFIGDDFVASALARMRVSYW